MARVPGGTMREKKPVEILIDHARQLVAKQPNCEPRAREIVELFQSEVAAGESVEHELELAIEDLDEMRRDK